MSIITVWKLKLNYYNTHHLFSLEPKLYLKAQLASLPPPNAIIVLRV